MVYSHSVYPHDPDHMSAYTACNALLYVDKSKYPRRVRWLDCSDTPLYPSSGRNKTRTQQGNIQDLCYVNSKGKHILVTFEDFDTILAYDLEYDELEWSISGSLSGMRQKPSLCSITTDWDDHLFACDCNNKCIQMFSTEGKYMGAAVLKEREQGLGKPWWIRWSQELSCLNCCPW